jgi:predicted metalloprotease with PDZ domain
MRALTFSLILIALGGGEARPQGTDTARYRIEVSGSDAPALRVTADIPYAGGRVFVDSIQAQHLARGWATFVRDLRARDAAGREIALTPIDSTAAWSLPEGVAGPLTLEYEIDLAFAREPYPPGNEQAGQVFDDALYLVTKPLFVVSEAVAETAVELSLPEGWEAAAPWGRDAAASSGPAGSGPASFRVPDRNSLLRNSLIVGRFGAVRIQEGGIDLTLALPGSMREAEALVQSALGGPLRRYLEIFPGGPPGAYLMTFFYASAEDGESFLDSSAFTTTQPVAPDGAILWANFLAHELLHYWIGQRIRGEDYGTSQWLGEGFTEYLANLTLVREGIVDEPTFRRKAEKHVGNYLYYQWSSAFEAPILEAGQRKGYNRFGVYDGGWVVAACLDARLRERSGGARTFEDLLGALWEGFGRPRTLYRYEDVVATASEVAGEDLAAFFAAHVAGRETLPVEECLATLGYTLYAKPYAGEAYLAPADAAALAAWIGNVTVE